MPAAAVAWGHDGGGGFFQKDFPEWKDVEDAEWRINGGCMDVDDARRVVSNRDQ
jgi:hypothetical protein